MLLLIFMLTIPTLIPAYPAFESGVDVQGVAHVPTSSDVVPSLSRYFVLNYCMFSRGLDGHLLGLIKHPKTLAGDRSSVCVCCAHGQAPRPRNVLSVRDHRLSVDLVLVSTTPRERDVWTKAFLWRGVSLKMAYDDTATPLFKWNTREIRRIVVTCSVFNDDRTGLPCCFICWGGGAYDSTGTYLGTWDGRGTVKYWYWYW